MAAVSIPTTGDTVYDNAAGTTTTGNGYYTVGSGSNILGYYRITGGVELLQVSEYVHRKINK